jgi:hypothetical protein
MRQLIIVLFSVILLAACGGGSGGGSSTTPQTPIPQPADPTATVSFTASSGEANTDVVIANLTGSENIDSWTFELNGITGYIVVNGQNVLIENNSVDVSSYASKDFQLMLNHNTAGTYNIAVTGFTVATKSYNLTDNQDITITAAPVVTGLANIILGTGNLFIPIEESSDTNQQTIIKGNSLETFYMNNVKVSLYTFTKGVVGKELFQELTGNLRNLRLPAQKYIVVANGTKNINGKIVNFRASGDFTVPERGSASISLNLTAKGLSAEYMTQLESYDSPYVNGDTKFVTFSDIMQANSCIQTLKEDHFVLKVNGSTSLKYEYFCLPGDAIYGGWAIQTNHFVTMSFKADSMSDAYSIDLQGEFQRVNVSFTLPKGNSSLDINLSNVAMSDEDLQVDIDGPGLSTEHPLTSYNLGYSVNIIE